MKTRSPSRRGDRGLRLWPVGRALALTFTLAVLVAAGVFYTGWELLAVQGLKPQRRIDAKTLFDLVTLSFGVVAGAGALVALVVAYRRQRVDEEGARREATRLHTERFTTAVGQLGDESPAVRLGGVHALAGLADDAPDSGLRQTCIDVLCAYLQLPFTPDPGTDDANRKEHHRYLALRKVRHTILRLIGDHYRRAPETHGSWQGCDLDLTGVIIDGELDFTGARFSGGRVSFAGARFSEDTVSFSYVEFAGGDVHFEHATFSDDAMLFFIDAEFSGGDVHFNSATFSCDVFFTNARFSGGTVSFGHARFSGGSVNFSEATFLGGFVSFAHVEFEDCAVSFDSVTFHDAPVQNDDPDSVLFIGMRYSGGSMTLEGATGPAPEGLLEGLGSPVPPTVILPPAWT
ncbi:pentapeptide repeat-containing protein [Streptomyces sp. PTY087I2]|uniref:pentapeptide repeat-containing protein n=1 Tax=Streptomyces sp. PTY087I2 TaxID=1819298 RepID=UPI00080BB40D|nr:pentapeptide repeat-containing protein [Streptomyces sp. PTY087I2]OCC08565.1 hypothetical protein A3Q37_05605 [Streptomyces sp. PTY087I2]